jgi:hypothetical protein
MTERYAHLIQDMKREAVLPFEENFAKSRNSGRVISLEQANM